MIIIKNISKTINFNRFISKIDRFISKIDIVDSIKSLESESTTIGQSNSDFRFDSKSSIRFGDPNRISLIVTNSFTKIVMAMMPNLQKIPELTKTDCESAINSELKQCSSPLDWFGI